ncbi:hypothetical protein MTR67_013254 [Solanum verrucosum]|uniref:Glycosyltransferase N-terminal domain-containing protein n=1 Tax=Solanum verrucosum TaxID=315347 RepID=A0AAF0TI95_SOLVR|nr:hypothetical protein MTR67_013254 [Solanum verrucosum]
MIKDLPSNDGCFTPEFIKFVRSEHEYSKFNSGKIYNTSRVIEGPFLDLLSKEQINKGKKQWALGPFNPITISGPTQQRHYSLIWLDKQVPKSVIFVSFGTTTSFSYEQIKEIAIGLEQSQQKFIWVLRDADKENVFLDDFTKKIELPKGWIFESLWLEFMHGEYVNGSSFSRMANAKILEVGLVVKDWAQRDELVTFDRIEKVVRILMASKEGEEMRKRAKDLSLGVKNAVEENGVTKNEFDAFIAHITKAI